MPPASPAVRKADLVADDLMRRVCVGELAVGSVLPKEDALAAQYDVNRSVVREAIKLLEVHGIAKPVRRRGTIVLDPMQSLSPGVLRRLLAPTAGRIDLRMLEGLLEVRAHLDIEMSGLAAERRTDEDLAEMEAVIERARRAVHDPRVYAETTVQLAHAIARATHNPVYQMLVHWNDVVGADLGALFRVIRPAGDPHLQGLSLLVDLIRRRETDAIRSLVRAFHQWATPRLVAAAQLQSGAPLSSIHALESRP